MRQSTQLSVDKYLAICEQLGEEPDPNRMPLDASQFPAEVQVAFFIHDMLSDNWEGMSGSYLGKDWADVGYLMTLYEVDNPKIVMYFAKMYERINIAFQAEEAQKKRKADERKSKAGGGGKTYTHSVKG